MDTEDTLRDAVEAAFEANETEAAGTETVVETPEVSQEAATNAEETTSGESVDAKPPPRERDEHGRFREKAARTRAEAEVPGKPKEQPAARTRAQAATPVQPAVAQQQPAPAVEVKAPQSWKPAAREKWAAVPPEVRQEVERREKEMARTLQDTAPARQFYGEMQRLIQPFAGIVHAQGGPFKAYENFLHHANILQVGTPAQKAGLVAHLVKSFGIGVDALAAALDGQPVPQGQQAPSQVDPAALARQVRQEVLADIQRQSAQRLHSQATQEIEEFGSSKEFFEDVREDMADLLESYARRGRALSPEEAYSMAVRNHPDVSEVLRQRDEAKAATAKLAATQQQRAAASTIRSKPSGVTHAEAPKDLRGDIEAAMAAAGRRT